VHTLGPFAPIPATSDAQAVEDSLPILAAASDSERAQTVLPAQTYVWRREDSKLDKKLWSYDEFVRKNAWKWIDNGTQSETNKDYEEVDRLRERQREEMVRSG
jgi:hypothetical protein